MDICNDIAAEGYTGFNLSSRQTGLTSGKEVM
jgi:hypothetical protein